MDHHVLLVSSETLDLLIELRMSPLPLSKEERGDVCPPSLPFFPPVLQEEFVPFSCLVLKYVNSQKGCVEITRIVSLLTWVIFQHARMC